MPRSIASASLVVLMLASLGSPLAAQSASPVPVSPRPGSSPGAAVQGLDVTGSSPGLGFEEPGWRRITTDGGPAAREDHTWTVDGEGSSAFLFGGRDGGRAFGDLWRYDLETDAWSRIRPTGRRPGARFGHSAAWVEGQGLVVFAGQRGADFFGDLWVFDPERERWTELPDRGGSPRPRYGSCAVVGADGRLRISHGFTFAGRFDDTRAYDFGSRRWASVAPDGRRPGERCLHDCFTSIDGQLVLYGGQDDTQSALPDLWIMQADGGWRRRSDPAAAPRRLYAVTEAGAHAWIFGGAGRGSERLGDLWRVDRGSLEFERVDVPGSGPSPRSAATLITDAARGRLLLFGGLGRQGAQADVWQLIDRVATRAATAAGPAADPSASSSPDATAEDAQTT